MSSEPFDCRPLTASRPWRTDSVLQRSRHARRQSQASRDTFRRMLELRRTAYQNILVEEEEEEEEEDREQQGDKCNAPSFQPIRKPWTMSTRNVAYDDFVYEEDDEDVPDDECSLEESLGEDCYGNDNGSTTQTTLDTSNHSLESSKFIPTDNPEFALRRELQTKLDCMYIDHFHVIESEGLGTGKCTVQVPHDDDDDAVVQTQQQQQQQEKVLDELTLQMAQMYTGHFREIVTNNNIDDDDDDDDDMISAFQQEEQVEEQDGDQQEDPEQQQPPQEPQATPASSPVKSILMLPSIPPFRSTSIDDDDEYSEYTMEETVIVENPNAMTMLPTIVSPDTHHDDDDDDDDYTEYTIEETVQSNLPYHHDNDDDDDEYEEVTVMDESVLRQNRPTMMPGPIVVASTSLLAGGVLNDDDEYTECTVEDSRVGEQQQKIEKEDSSSSSSSSEDEEIVSEDEDGEFADGPVITVDHRHNRMMRNDDASVCTELTTDDFSLRPHHRTLLPAPLLPQETFYDSLQNTKNDETYSTQEESTSVHSWEDAASAYSSAAVASVTSSNNTTPNVLATLIRHDLWSASPSTVVQALSVLSHEVKAGAGQSAQIVQFGGLLAVLRAMETHTRDITVQVAACNLLTQLDAFAVAIAQVGTLETLVTTLKQHSSNVDVCRAATNAVAAIGEPARGLVETLAACMQQHTNDTSIQESCFSALASLCMEDATSLQTLSQVGGLVSMTIALQKPWKNASRKQEAISTLSMLLRCLDQVQDER